MLRRAVFVTLVLALASCGGAADIPCELDSRCLRYGLTADIPILDPFHAEAAEAGMIFRQIYDTLVYRRADDHEFAPGLATDWDVSPDGLVYTFSLRTDVVFHDGSRFDAAAVGRNIERIYDPAITQIAGARTLGAPNSIRGGCRLLDSADFSVSLSGLVRRPVAAIPGYRQPGGARRE